MAELQLRTMTAADFPAVAELIYHSTNDWYRTNLGREVFVGKPADCRVFCEVYQALDPGQAVVVEDPASGRLAGSCFVHPRPTHISLGIVNTSADFAGRGVARMLINHVTDLADAQGLPCRLVSSAMNLDSYSLYNRSGFVTTGFFQDMLLTPPDRGVDAPPYAGRVRAATGDDVPRIVELEHRVLGIRRPGDWAYFVSNELAIWTLLVAEDADGVLTGTLCAVDHPGSSMLGPGTMADDDAAFALLGAHLNLRRGKPTLAVIPADRPAIARALYAWGARNCETHVSQCRGEAAPVRGVTLPTFLPESA